MTDTLTTLDHLVGVLARDPQGTVERERGRDLYWTLTSDDSSETRAVLRVRHHGKSDYVGPIEYAMTAQLAIERLEERTATGYAVNTFLVHDPRNMTIGIEQDMPRLNRKALDLYADSMMQLVQDRAVEVARHIIANTPEESA